MVVWQGITAAGTAVPIQVTEAGEVVAATNTPVPGPQGPEGPQGPSGTDGSPGKDGKDGAPGRDGEQWVELNSRHIWPTRNVGITVLLDSLFSSTLTVQGESYCGYYNSNDSLSGGVVIKPGGQLVVQAGVGSKENPTTAIQGNHTDTDYKMTGSWNIKSDGTASFKNMFFKLTEAQSSEFSSGSGSCAVVVALEDGLHLDLMATLQQLMARKG